MGSWKNISLCGTYDAGVREKKKGGGVLVG